MHLCDEREGSLVGGPCADHITFGLWIRYPPEQHRLAITLVLHHIARQTPARWLPDILPAHGLPRYARAVAVRGAT